VGPGVGIIPSGCGVVGRGVGGGVNMDIGVGGRSVGGGVGERETGALVGRETGAMVGRKTGAMVGRETGALVGRETGALVGRETGARETGALVGRETGESISTGLPLSAGAIGLVSAGAMATGDEFTLSGAHSQSPIKPGKKEH